MAIQTQYSRTSFSPTTSSAVSRTSGQAHLSRSRQGTQRASSQAARPEAREAGWFSRAAQKIGTSLREALTQPQITQKPPSVDNYMTGQPYQVAASRHFQHKTSGAPNTHSRSTLLQASPDALLIAACNNVINTGDLKSLCNPTAPTPRPASRPARPINPRA